MSVDYDACEMRTWAQCCIWLSESNRSFREAGVIGKESCDLWKILNDPKRCPHVEMGAQIRGMSISDAYALKKLDPAAYKALRGVAKGPNFGLPGGMKEARLMDYCRQNYGVVLTMQEAIRAREVWCTIYRESEPYLEAIKDMIGRKFGSRGIIEQYVSHRYRGDVGFTDGANGLFQALAADIAKQAGWRMVMEAYGDPTSPLYGCRPLAFVHDEWLFAIPLDRIHEAGYRMAEIMCKTAMEYCPDLLFTAAPAAMFRWSKSAGDPILDSNGRLQVYEIAKGLPIPANQNAYMKKVA